MKRMSLTKIKGLSSELYKKGFKNIQNIDFSANVIQKMSSKYSELSEMTWKVRVCRNSWLHDLIFNFH